jgi:hypothetical protein
MNLLTLSLAILSLIQIPGTNSQNDLACNQLDTFMLSVTNNTCSIKFANDPEICYPFIEKIAKTSPKIVSEMQKLEEACKEELFQTKTVAVLIHLKSEHKKIGCNRRNLNVKEKYICKKINDDTKKVNKILENNHQL